MTSKKIPLTERLRTAVPHGYTLPTAMGLYAEDFYSIAGKITNMQQRYSDIYDNYIKPYDGTEDSPKAVRELVVEAGALPPAERNVLLFRLLVEPFAAIDTTEKGDPL